MRRALLALAIAAGLAIGTVMPTAALGLTQVTLNCDDGTSWTAVVDTDTLTGLVASVQAMLDYPAGLTCTLLQTPVVRVGEVALAASNPFIVAGGRWQVACSVIAQGFNGGLFDGGIVARAPGAWYSVTSTSTLQTDEVFIWVNIAVNVHQKDGTAGAFFGSLNETIPANQFCPQLATIDNQSGQVGESHFSSEGPNADICMTLPIKDTTTGFVTTFVTAKVTKTTDQTSGPGQVNFPLVTLNKYVQFGFQDTGNPGQQPTDTSGAAIHDKLNGPPASPSDPLATCPNTAQITPSPAFNLGSNDGTNKQYGNITIRTS